LITLGENVVNNNSKKPFVTYVMTMAVSLLLYAVLLVASLLWLKAGVDAPLKYAVAIMPVLPALGILLAVVQFCQAMDELQLRIQLESLAFGFAATAIATFTYGFLQNAGFPEVSWVWVWPVMAVSWMLGQLAARWRYR
jgi:flagellar motor component MotA